MVKPQGYPDGLPMYCRTCMVEVPTIHEHAEKNGEPALEIFCPKGHFVTRFIMSPGSATGWALDPEAYKRRHP